MSRSFFLLVLNAYTLREHERIKEATTFNTFCYFVDKFSIIFISFRVEHFITRCFYKRCLKTTAPKP